MVNWALLPPGRAFREHYHEDMCEVFIIASGSAEVWADDTPSQTLGPGDAWIVPAMVRHRMRNCGDTEVRFAVFGISAEQGGKTVVSEVNP
jgi:mannose-6-phosphate isomerase-like protein (cupin superfamily)